MAFVIDCYNKYDGWDRDHAVETFEINGNVYAIKEVEICWGLPMLEYKTDQDERPQIYCIYETLEEAQQFVQWMKMINR